MAYRDDLEAALMHAEAAERELDEAKRVHAHDEARIAELEKQLAAAKAGVKKAEAKKAEAKKAESPSPPPSRKKPASSGSPGRRIAVGAVVAVAFLTLIFFAPMRDCLTREASLPRARDGSVDVMAALPIASKLAHNTFADADLAGLYAPFVDDNGLSHLGYGGELTFRFRSPSLALQIIPTAPALGAPTTDNRKPCSVTAWTTKDTPLRLSRPRLENCGLPMALPPLKCTVAEIRARARAAGAPAGAFAGVRLTIGRRWSVTIEDQTTHSIVFSKDFPDDCH